MGLPLDSIERHNIACAKGRHWPVKVPIMPTFIVISAPSHGSLRTSGRAFTECCSSSHVAPSPQTSKKPFAQKQKLVRTCYRVMSKRRVLSLGLCGKKMVL